MARRLGSHVNSDNMHPNAALIITECSQYNTTEWFLYFAKDIIYKIKIKDIFSFLLPNILN